VTFINYYCIISFRYNDNESWPQSPDGAGGSLVSSEYNPDNDQDSSIYWRSSYELGGSPGADDIEGVIYIKQEPVDIEEIHEDAIFSSDENILDQNYPNPFTEETYIHYKLGDNAFVNLSVYNIMGQKMVTLVNENQTNGSHLVRWNIHRHNALDVREGLYFYRLELQNGTDSKVFTRKMIKTK